MQTVPKTILIDRLDASQLEVCKPILAQVVFEEDSYIASFVDANVNASGESELDAIEMLKDMLEMRFQSFEEHQHRLSPELTRHRLVLNEHIRKVG